MNNTGNPVGSKAFLDFEDNVKNLDLAVNSDELSWRDRLGRDRKSFEGMEREFDSAQDSRESRFNDFIAASGYQFAGDYGPGIEITEYNQLIRDSNGEFWRVSGQVELPYTTTGAGIPEDDALVPAGDAVLRQDLANPDKGAAMVAYGGDLSVADKLHQLDRLPVFSDGSCVDAVAQMARVSDMWVRQESGQIFISMGQVPETDITVERFLTEYMMNPNGDGLYLLNQIRSGYGSAPGVTSVSLTVDDVIGSWINTEQDTWYTTTVGDSFSVTTPNCDTIELRFFRNAAGGVWNISVYDTDNNIVATKAVTTNGSGTVYFNIAEGLRRGVYRVFGVFAGDDPANPPSGGAGTSRGWLYSPSFLRTTDHSDLAYRSGVSPYLMRRSVQEFAIRARPAGSSATMHWVPLHSGVSTVTRNIGITIHIEGGDSEGAYLASGLPAIPAKCESFTILQRYDAFNPDDDTQKMWTGWLSHKWKRDGTLTTQHRVVFNIDTQVDSPYMFMMAGWTPDVPRISVKSPGGVVWATANGNSTPSLPVSGSILRYGGQVAAGRLLMYACDVDVLSAINYGKPYSAGLNSSHVTDRSDDVSKYYLLASRNGVIPAGEEWSMRSVTACGIGRHPVSVSGGGVGIA